MTAGGPHVLIDVTAVPSDRGGVGRYVDGLVGALVRTGSPLSIVCQRADHERYGRLAPQAQVVAAPAAVAHRPARLAWEQTALPLIARQVQADVLHCPTYTLPLRVSQPVVVTLHDACSFEEPSQLSAERGTFVRSATRLAVRRAARLIVPSRATRDELASVVDTHEAQVDVAHHGVNPALFHPPSEDERRHVRLRMGLGDQPYVAFLGRLEPRKNPASLVRGWVLACQGRTDPPALVLAGGGAEDRELDRAIAEVPPELRVLRPGFLRDVDLPGFLGGAVAVALPSRKEGFGLPVLEAMACGAAVLTTERSAVPEYAEDAVAYCEQGGEAVGAALRALLDDDARRLSLSAAALTRASVFTWERSAEAHLASYAAAAATG